MRKFIILFVLFFSGKICAEPYNVLEKPLTSAPDVVEFFSFYCGPCYQFVENYPVSDRINEILSPGKSVTKYHVSAMGKMGKALTESWAIAIAMGIEHKVEKPLFVAIQQHRSINTPEDIKDIFIQQGVSSQEYNSAKHSLIVRSIVAQQESMAEKLEVRGTPSFYIKGRYLINNGEIKAETPEEYITNFTQLVKELLIE